MENNILSNENILLIVNEYPDNFTQIFRSEKNFNIYGDTFEYINSTYTGNKFSEKLYKYIYGERKCKKCNSLLTSKQFRSFFDGYMEEFCSKKCALHSDERTAHIKQTKLDRYGNSSYNNLLKQQTTMFSKYGVKHNWNGNSPLREKCYETNLKLHGSRTWNNPLQSVKTKNEHGSYVKQVETLKATCQRKYGVNFALQLPSVKEKCIQTNLKKYGVKYPAQCSDIIEKCYKKWKLFTFPSGNKINVQGYEPTAISLLLQNFTENEITTRKKDMPEIWYTLNDIRHRYYPDIFIKSQNRFIEVKSEYTYQSKKEENILKHNQCLDYGYKHEIWIFNTKQRLMEVINNYASR